MSPVLISRTVLRTEVVHLASKMPSLVTTDRQRFLSSTQKVVREVILTCLWKLVNGACSRGHGLDSIYRTYIKLPSEEGVRLSTIRMPLIAMASTIWTSPGAARFGLEVPTRFKVRYKSGSQRFVYIFDHHGFVRLPYSLLVQCSLQIETY